MYAIRSYYAPLAHRCPADFEVAFADRLFAELAQHRQQHTAEHAAYMRPVADVRTALSRSLGDAAGEVHGEEQADDHQRVEPDLEADS